MAVIGHSKFVGEVVWLGGVYPSTDGIRSHHRQLMELEWDGPAGDRHAGRTRDACVRVKEVHKKGTEIANVRQLSIVSEEELEAIADAMGANWLNPEWLGASIVIRGIPDFTHVPPSSRLQGPDGCTLVIDMLNAPCNLPAREMNRHQEGLGKGFKVAAEGRRGVTAWVERPGKLRPGDPLKLVIPLQRMWNPG